MFTEFIDLINSTVFPIAMCVIMLTQNNKTTAELKKSIDNNTLTITKLCEKSTRANKKGVNTPLLLLIRMRLLFFLVAFVPNYQ